jgi:type IV pilus assembly protein PilB
MSLESSKILPFISSELASLALDFGFIDAGKYASAKNFANETNVDHYSLLRSDGLINEDQMVGALAEKYGLGSTLDFSLMELPERFPIKYCIQNGLLPILLPDSSKNYVGIAAPNSLNTLRNLNLLSGQKFTAIFIPFAALKDGILELETPGYLAVKKSKAKDKTNILLSGWKDVEHSLSINSSDKADNSISFGAIPESAEVQSADKKIAEDKINALLKTDIKQVADAMLTGGDVVNGVNKIFETAVLEKVSDIHLEKFRDKARLRFRKNGALITPKNLQGFVEKNYSAIISRIKIIAGLDIAERRLPQDGGANFVSTKLNIDVDLRISIVPTSTGERAVMRILNKASLSLDINALGFSNDQLKIFKNSIESPQGLVLVTGPTGSGKSTTLYGAINYLNKDDVNILTAEDPVEYTVSGVGQVQMKEEIGLTFAAALRSFLRQDPEIILVGEIRDAETADIATKAALTGHLVLSTLHTNSAVGAITRLINMGLPRYLVSNALTCVVAQRLIRTLCPKCAKDLPQSAIDEFSTHPMFSQLLGVKLRHGVGCSHCNNTGFASRKAVHEVLNVDASLKALINKESSELEMVSAAREKKFQTMFERGLDFVKSGETSFDELLRSIPLESS